MIPPGQRAAWALYGASVLALLACRFWPGATPVWVWTTAIGVHLAVLAAAGWRAWRERVALRALRAGVRDLMAATERLGARVSAPPDPAVTPAARAAAEAAARDEVTRQLAKLRSITRATPGAANGRDTPR